MCVQNWGIRRKLVQAALRTSEAGRSFPEATRGRNLTQGFLMHCCVINGDKHSTVSVHNFGEAMAIFSKFARIMDLKLDDQDDAIPGGTYKAEIFG